MNPLNVRLCATAVARVTSELSIHSSLGRCNISSKFHSGTMFCCSKVDVFNEWLHTFKKEGVSEPQESIEAILAHVLSKESKYSSHLDHELSEDQKKLLKRLCECRLARIPIQYIVGGWQFRRLNLVLSPPVFIPRPETETLVDIILERISKKQGAVNVLEVGCGSGAISFALAQENLKVSCTAVDQCGLACRVARKNSSSLSLNDRVKILWARLTDGGELIDCSSECKLVDVLPKDIDVVVSNPPYVPSHHLIHLQPEILLYEDLKALDGGKDGLKVILPLIKFASTLLKSSSKSDGEGLLLIEVDPSHPAILQKWLCEDKNSELKMHLKYVHNDLFGKERFVELVKI